MLRQRTQLNQRRIRTAKKVRRKFPQIDRAIGNLRTPSQAIWLTRNIRRSLKVDKAKRTRPTEPFARKVQIRPLLTQTPPTQLRDLRYDSAPGILWPGLGDAADGRANGGSTNSVGTTQASVPRAFSQGSWYTDGWKREIIPMVILGPGSIASNGCQRSALSSLSPTLRKIQKRMYLAKRGT